MHCGGEAAQERSLQAKKASHYLRIPTMDTSVVTHNPSREPQTAELDADIGSASVKLKARMTPSGLIAAGALASGVLLSVAALVWAATTVKRRHPFAAALGRR